MATKIKNITPYTKEICGQTVAPGEEVYVPSNTKIHSRIWAKVWRSAPDSLLPKELLEAKSEKSVGERKDRDSGKKFTADKNKNRKLNNSGFGTAFTNVISNTVTDKGVKVPSVETVALGQKADNVKDTVLTEVTTDLTSTAKTTDAATEEFNKHNKKKN